MPRTLRGAENSSSNGFHIPTMNKSKRISVVIPTFNRCRFIREAVDSVLNQDIQGYDLEILVIDDGSTDGTQAELKRYGNKIRYFYQDNSGAGAARNRGIKEAQGEWLTFLDSDDRWLPFKLSLQMAIIDRAPDCRVLYGNFLIFKEGRTISERGVDSWAESLRLSKHKEWKEMFSSRFDSADIGITHNGKAFSIYKGNIFGGLIFQICIPCWTAIISKQCITDHIRFSETLPTWEDVWFFCQLAEEHEIYFMDIITAENRGHTGPRLTQAGSVKTLLCHINICDGIYFKSSSSHRPPDIELNALYRELHKRLFKQYLRNGMHSEAAAVRNKLDRMGVGLKDISYLLYRTAFLFPWNPIHQLVKMKQRFAKD
jgi:glycosyltransferase involved in cell wall biosynthesis